MNLFNISLKVNGYPLKKAKTVFETIQKKNETELSTYIEAKKQDIVEYHLKHNPF